MGIIIGLFIGLVLLAGLSYVGVTIYDFIVDYKLIKKTIAGVMNHNFQGKMVRLKPGEYLSWDEIGESERKDYGSIEGYYLLIDIARREL